MKNAWLEVSLLCCVAEGIIKMRKPVSVSVTECGLIVICDDGSIWELFQNKWERIKDIPQDNLNDTEKDLPQMLIKQN